MDDNAEHELREARSEITRHHELIKELRDGLSWALDLLHWADDLDGERVLEGDDQEKYDHYLRVLSRQVS